MHRSNTDENNFEPINFKKTARSGATEFLNETSRLDLKQPKQDSCWQGDIPQLSNDGLEWSGAEGSEQDISQECKSGECKSKLECKLIDKTQQEFGTMQEVITGNEEETEMKD